MAQYKNCIRSNMYHSFVLGDLNMLGLALLLPYTECNLDPSNSASNAGVNVNANHLYFLA